MPDTIQTTDKNGTSNTIKNNNLVVSNYTSGNANITISSSIPVSKDTKSVDGLNGYRIQNLKVKQAVHKPKYIRNTKSDVLQKNQNSYPSVVATKNDEHGYKYDYNIIIQKKITDAIQAVKEDMNIPSAYSRLELNKKFHKMFNRFRIEYPDYFMNGTLAYVVMTRPDLNLFDDNGLILDQIANDPQLYYIMNASIDTAKTLTKNYSGAHDFNPLLSNTLTSLDISDESIDTLETGETFTGFKTQYAKSNIRSMTAGTISLKFPETYNMAITHAHQLWCTYESCVYRGSLKPKPQYIWNKELDYACDIYYFLLDKEDMIIRYWCKYTGCFPLGVNKSVFSYDVGSELSHPELSVTYAYFAREDMSSIVINDFNNNAGGITNGFKYRSNYVPSVGVSGSTWANAPFVEAITRDTGIGSSTSNLYALRFRN